MPKTIKTIFLIIRWMYLDYNWENITSVFNIFSIYIRNTVYKQGITATTQLYTSLSTHVCSDLSFT